LVSAAAGAQERPTKVVYPRESVVDGVHVREMVTLEGQAAQDYLAAQERLATSVAERRAVELQAAAQGGGRGGAFARVPLEAKVVKGAPYSAEVVTESVQVLSDGNRIVRRTTGRVYRDGQGRTRREDDLQPGQVVGISIIDPVGQVAYSLDTQSKTAWKTPSAAGAVLMNKLSQASVEDPAELERRRQVEAAMVVDAKRQEAAVASPTRMPPPPPPAPTPVIGRAYTAWDEKTEVLPARSIEGVMAEGKRTTRTIPAGAIGNEQPIVSVTEEWRSPELQVLVMTRTADPRTGESVYKLQNIVRAEPNISWFEVPADYTIKETGVRKLTPSIK
jgi:hypothetical protein